MLLVSDSNIFIDFEAGELTDRLFQLPHEIVVPDTLFDEELRDRSPHLIGLGLQVRSLTGDQVTEAYGLRGTYTGPSVNDLLALVLAKSLGCPLVTGDLRLRAAAQSEGLDLLGTLTLVEQMFDSELVALQQIEEAYDRMRTAGRRLPWEAVAAQLQGFRHDGATDLGAHRSSQELTAPRGAGLLLSKVRHR